MELPRQLWFPRRIDAVPSRQRPSAALMLLAVTVVFAALIIAVRGLAAFMPVSPNPFAPYADAFPGQPSRTIQPRVLACQPAYAGKACYVRPATKSVSQMSVVLSGDMIYETYFTVHGDLLRVGDLIAMWGQPVVKVSEHLTRYRWNGSRIRATAIAFGKRHSLWSPVPFVSMTLPESPGPSKAP